MFNPSSIVARGRKSEHAFCPKQFLYEHSVAVFVGYSINNKFIKYLTTKVHNLNKHAECLHVYFHDPVSSIAQILHQSRVPVDVLKQMSSR
jgi:hypothetical protein